MPALVKRIWRSLRCESGSSAATRDPAPSDTDAPAPDARRIREVEEEYAWVAANPCGCGGRWRLQLMHAQTTFGNLIDELAVQCETCGADRTFRFEFRE